MTHISITKLYDLLSDKIGKESAANLIIFIEEKIKEELATQSQILATKEDIRKVEIGLIKWMFVFWVTLAIMIFGLYLK